MVNRKTVTVASSTTAFLMAIIATAILTTTPDVCESPTLTNNPISKSDNKGPLRAIIPDNKCERLTNVVLTNNGFEKLKNNPFIGSILPRPVPTTSLPTTHEYCELSRWIWEGQTEDYRSKLENLLQYMITEQCIPELWQYTNLPTWYQQVWKWNQEGKVPNVESNTAILYLRGET